MHSIIRLNILKSKNFFFLAFFVFSVANANQLQPQFNFVHGQKYPNRSALVSGQEETTPHESYALSPLNSADLGGFNELVPYVLPSPDQNEAGSCLYMALTGSAEWWLARRNPYASRAPDGPIDLSERYIMNLAGLEEDSNGVDNWKTDSIYVFNRHHRAALNREYRYTKGWYIWTEDGYEHQGDKVGSYGTSYNWINELDTYDLDTWGQPLPHFERDVLYADPESNQWNVGIGDGSWIRKIKTALQTRKAPVIVVYNHYGYWHAVLVVGFDDNASSRECPFVEGNRKYMVDRPIELRNKAQQSDDLVEQKRLIALAKKMEETSEKIENAYEEQGGCHSRGVFYVRDSIYADASEALYDYDLNTKGEEEHYSKRIILREYDWVRYLSNHAVAIYIK